MKRLKIESGGGLIKAIVNAKGTLKSLNVDESLFVPSEKAVVEDLIVAAIRDAQKKNLEIRQKKRWQK